MILYLHGFRSSPHSAKAMMLAAHMQAAGRGAEFLCPQLPASPCEAIGVVEQCIRHASPEKLTVIGSSLGGFYATWLAEQKGCKAVLLNPAVQPRRDLKQYVGVSTSYHSEAPFEFKPEYLDEFALFETDTITSPERYFLIAAKGDELLDWREMIAHYPGTQQCVVEGSDHGLSDFDRYIDRVIAFCDSEGSN
jgi:hypothetical protein